MLVPFTSHEDHDFFQHLEMHMRAENPPICGRDHLSYRSYYYPVKHVIDGDLCEQYNTLGAEKQKSISEELDRTPADVSKKLEDIRTRYAFWFLIIFYNVYQTMTDMCIKINYVLFFSIRWMVFIFNFGPYVFSVGLEFRSFSQFSKCITEI